MKSKLSFFDRVFLCLFLFRALGANEFELGTALAVVAFLLIPALLDLSNPDGDI